MRTPPNHAMQLTGSARHAGCSRRPTAAAIAPHSAVSELGVVRPFTRMRRIRIILFVIVGILLATATYQRENSSRYHFDTLREERRVTTRILGIPVLSRQLPPEDPYPELYSQITGKTPDPNRWRQMPPDYVRSFWSSMYRCYGFGFEFQERRQLLAAVYQKFRAGGSQEAAAAQLHRIDDLIPAPTQPRKELDFERIDALRKELGLKSYLNP
jgi:hypothetical protein